MAGPVGARFGALASVVVAATVMVTLVASPAEARRRHVAKGGGYNPPYADMVVDAKTGRVLHAVNEDALRHPASVTKVMTLYLLFEQLEKGRFSLDTRACASAPMPSPWLLPSSGCGAGQTIEVEDAIKALVTKSANDVAATVAENIGGSEDAFAEMMTRKARQLGMNRTVYKNASGLPDPGQVTTARDLVTLGRAIQDRFPRYYTYFSYALLQLCRRDPSQPQPADRPRGRHGRHQDRLYPHVGLQPADLGEDGRPPCRRGRARRPVRRRARQPDGRLLDDNIERAYAGARTAPAVGEGSASTSVASADDDSPVHDSRCLDPHDPEGRDQARDRGGCAPCPNFPCPRARRACARCGYAVHHANSQWQACRPSGRVHRDRSRSPAPPLRLPPVPRPRRRPPRPRG